MSIRAANAISNRHSEYRAAFAKHGFTGPLFEPLIDDLVKTGWLNLNATDALDRMCLEEALEPFADIAGEGSEDFGNDEKVVISFGRTTHYALTLGDLRRASSVLENRRRCLADANSESPIQAREE